MSERGGLTPEAATVVEDLLGAREREWIDASLRAVDVYRRPTVSVYCAPGISVRFNAHAFPGGTFGWEFADEAQARDDVRWWR